MGVALSAEPGLKAEFTPSFFVCIFCLARLKGLAMKALVVADMKKKHFNSAIFVIALDTKGLGS